MTCKHHEALEARFELAGVAGRSSSQSGVEGGAEIVRKIEGAEDHLDGCDLLEEITIATETLTKALGQHCSKAKQSGLCLLECRSKLSVGICLRRGSLIVENRL